MTTKIVPERFTDSKLQFLALKVLAITSMTLIFVISIGLIHGFLFDISLYLHLFIYVVFSVVAIIGVIKEKRKIIGSIVLLFIVLKILGITIASSFNNLITLGGGLMMPFLSFFSEILIIIFYLSLSFSSSQSNIQKRILSYGSFVIIFLLFIKLEFFTWSANMISIKHDVQTFSFVSAILSAIWLIHCIKTNGKYKKIIISILILSTLIFLFNLILTILSRI